MSAAGYLKWSDAMKLIDLCKKERNYRYVALLALGFFSGLRISDIKKLKYGDLRKTFKITEKKTSKNRHITMSDETLALLFECQKKLGKTDDDYIVSYCVSQTARIIQKLCARNYIFGVNISNHSMRKTFGRALWENNGKNEASLVLLSEILVHSSTKMTRVYLGITNDEISNAYLSLSLKPVKGVRA